MTASTMADRELFSSKAKSGIGCRRWFQGSVEDRLKLWAANPILKQSIDVEAVCPTSRLGSMTAIEVPANRDTQPSVRGR